MKALILGWDFVKAKVKCASPMASKTPKPLLLTKRAITQSDAFNWVDTPPTSLRYS